MPSSSWWPALAIGLCSCQNSEPLVEAIVDPTRPEHFFDLPFPSDETLTNSGHPNLSGFPRADLPLARSVLGGWVQRLEEGVQGFGQNTPAYFRLKGPITPPQRTEGLPTDSYLWLDLNTHELLPLELHFIEDPYGDPFYASNTLVMAPLIGSGPRPGHTYAALIQRSANVKAPPDYVVPEQVTLALSEAGVHELPAVATVFTVLDSTGALRSLAEDVRSYLPPWRSAQLRRVNTLEYRQGQTPSGRDATLSIVTFEDGGTETTYLEAHEQGAESITDLTVGPMVVYEGSIPVWNYQGLAERPYMSPGLMHIQDVNEMSGWIDINNGDVQSTPERESMRVVVQIPRGSDGKPIAARGVVQYDHGTGGHAYNSVQRSGAADRGLDFQQVYADAGFAIISRDASLYGKRYPLIDEGFGASLGFYNIVNTLAFRDNQRQTALDGYVLRRYIEHQLNDDLLFGSIDVSHVRRQGHSLGSVTAHLGLAMSPDDYESALVSGTGGVFIHYFLDTGLLQEIDPATIGALFPLFGVEDIPDPITPTSIFGAVLGLDVAAWEHIDRMHPAGMLFQWQMDGSDPMSVAQDETVPITAVIAPGDWQTPDFTGRALVKALPNAREVGCTTLTDYDPHYCLWREDEGLQRLRDWLSE